MSWIVGSETASAAHRPALKRAREVAGVGEAEHEGLLGRPAAGLAQITAGQFPGRVVEQLLEVAARLECLGLQRGRTHAQRGRGVTSRPHSSSARNSMTSGSHR